MHTSQPDAVTMPAVPGRAFVIPAPDECRLAERRLRLDVVRLAVAVHEYGIQDSDSTVMETARTLLSFVDGEDYPK